MWPKLSKPSPPAGEGGGVSSLRRRSFLRDEGGAVLAVIALVIPATIGLVSLSLDLGRVMGLNTELQAIADGAAMAGAKELDGSDDSIDRATNAAMNLLRNAPQLAIDDSDPQIAIDSIVFYSSIGPTRADDVETSDPIDASYIEVTTVERWSRNFFAPVLALAGQSRTSASATAGAVQVACKVPPLMMCNPHDPNNFELEPGQMVALRMQGGAYQDGPGVFRLLDPPYAKPGAKPITEALASPAPPYCFIEDMSPRTGQVVEPYSRGINTRFDEYENNIQPETDYPPAPNVTQGRAPGTGNQCWDPALNTKPHEPGVLPRDSCFYEADGMTPSDGSGCEVWGDNNAYVGAGDWRSTEMYNQYMDTNHPGVTPPLWADTRWKLYLWELGYDQDGFPTGMSNLPDDGAPQCYQRKTGSTEVGDPERRIIYVAIIDCTKYEVKGTSLEGMKSLRYAKFFLTEPVSTEGSTYAEFIEMTEPGDDAGVLHHIVQLYR